VINCNLLELEKKIKEVTKKRGQKSGRIETGERNEI
jgi:hypothetical protein